MPPKKTRQNYLNLAEEKGLEFLFEGVPENSKVKYDWKCANGHVFQMRYNNVYLGQNCHICYDDRRGQTLVYGVEKYHELAEKRGIKFIDKRIPHHTHVPFEWECKEGHKWEVSYHNIDARESGCPGCYGNQRKTEEDYHNLAEERGFEFIDEEIPPNNCTSGNWRCKIGHEWRTCYNNINSKESGCPYCSQFSSERMCREIFEEITGHKFNKCRDKFLFGLELDGYNKDLKLAFEYNGKQHYEYIPHFHRNGEKDLKKQRERDEMKAMICDDSDINLIVIPYKYTFKTPDRLREFIVSELSNHLLIV
ncbi:MAG: hypothetical protein PHG66_01955 [Candidatus Colwellbacteria bacterium]|nr:hypothetical protein [Candidatus Colwellbacteria bacterium]